jgi:hypothetical protein
VAALALQGRRPFTEYRLGRRIRAEELARLEMSCRTKQKGVSVCYMLAATSAALELCVRSFVSKGLSLCLGASGSLEAS